MNKAIIFSFLLLFAAHLSAQTAENDSLIAAQTISIKLGTLANNQIEFFSKEKGAEIPFTITFGQELKEGDYFDFDYELYTADGVTLVCKSAKDQYGAQRVRIGLGFGKDAQPVREGKFFIFYKDLPKYQGTTTFNLRIFAKHPKREYGEIFRGDIYITTPKIEIISPDKQSFSIENPQFNMDDRDLWEKKPCISFSCKVRPKYDKNSLPSIEKYILYGVLRDKNDSANAPNPISTPAYATARRQRAAK